MIGVNDYGVHEDGERIGRIRYAKKTFARPLAGWHVTVPIPGPTFGSAADIDEAKQHCKTAWLAFKLKHGAAALARAYLDINHAERPGRR